MTEWITTRPTARKRHACLLCRRAILPGEDYSRTAGLDRSAAWTTKLCRHCERSAAAYCREYGMDEWYEQDVADYLSEDHPDLYAAMHAHWRYPDGELLPLPFQPRCIGCRCLIRGDQLWCPACDEARIDRITRGLDGIQRELRGIA